VRIRFGCGLDLRIYGNTCSAFINFNIFSSIITVCFTFIDCNNVNKLSFFFLCNFKCFVGGGGLLLISEVRICVFFYCVTDPTN
jgi:hypothetical protein